LNPSHRSVPHPGDPKSDREPRLADPALEQRLRDDGYAVVRVMSKARAREIERAVTALFPVSPQPNQHLSNWYLGLIDSDRELAVATARLTWREVMPALAVHVAGARCHYTSLAIKPGGADATPMHQHWPSTVDPFARRIGCWVLISPNDKGGGIFRLVPRSHQLLPFIRHATSGDYFDSFSGAVDRHYARDISLEPGEAVLFEDSILHGTGANQDTAMRIAAIGNFIGSGMRTATIQPDGEEAFAVLEAGRDDTMEAYLTSGRLNRRPRRIATLANRNRAISEAEFTQLLAMHRKATLDFDPLDLIRAPPRPDLQAVGRQRTRKPFSRLASFFGCPER
jgi:hypothetical protein